MATADIRESIRKANTESLRAELQRALPSMRAECISSSTREQLMGIVNELRNLLGEDSSIRSKIPENLIDNARAVVSRFFDGTVSVFETVTAPPVAVTGDFFHSSCNCCLCKIRLCKTS